MRKGSSCSGSRSAYSSTCTGSCLIMAGSQHCWAMWAHVMVLVTLPSELRSGLQASGLKVFCVAWQAALLALIVLQLGCMSVACPCRQHMLFWTMLA